MKKTNTNKTKKFLSLTLLLAISFNQVSFCMKREEEIVIDDTQKTENIETSMEQGGNLEIVCDDALKYMFEWLEQKDLNNLSECNKNLNKLVKTYMENPAMDSTRQINVNLRLTKEDISFFKKISKNFEEILPKLEKFIGNSDRQAFLTLTNPFTDKKSITLNKNTIANLEQTLLKYFSVNKKNKTIYLAKSLSKKYLKESDWKKKVVLNLTRDKRGAIVFLIIHLAPIILYINLNTSTGYKILASVLLYFMILGLILSPFDMLDEKIRHLTYDLSMTDGIPQYAATANDGVFIPMG